MRRRKSNSWLARRFWRIAPWALASVWLFAPVLALAQPLTGTFVGAGVGRKVAFSQNGKSRNDFAGVLRLKLDNGPEIPVFCIQIDVQVSRGNRYRSDGPVLALPNGCKIRYLLDHYPASTAKTADEAAARQLAIWVFSDGLDPATIQDATIRDRATALVADAAGKPCPLRNTSAPDLAIDPPTAAAAAGQLVAYTIRSEPAQAGHTVTVAVSGPAVISDAQGTNTGQQQQQLALDAQGTLGIWILSTGAGQSTISVSLPYVIEAGTVFSHIDSNQPTQRLVSAERRDLVASASAQGVWSASAPAPSPSVVPTPPGQPTATPPPATATPAPTHRPRESSPTPEASPAEQLTPTAEAEEKQTATAPAELAGAETAAAETAAAETAAAGPANQAGAEQGAAATPAQQASGAAGTAGPRPRALPRTGAPADLAIAPLIVGMLALIGGWIVRRRVRK
jgi:hypothetical protein